MEKESNTSRVLFVGGGTGGHFYPLIAIAEALNALPNGPQLYFAGPNAYDQKSLDAEHITYISVAAGKRRRYASFHNIVDFFKTLAGIFIALVKIFIIYPDVIMSKGGYTSVPVILAGAFLRIPVIIHESDSVMGSANRIGSRFARHVITSYPDVKVVHTKGIVHTLGIPIRKVLRTTNVDSVEDVGIDPERPVLFVIGGSQGAERINQLILDSLDELLVDYAIIHQTGTKNFDTCKFAADTLITNPSMRKNYYPLAFLDAVALNETYCRSSLIISRAGSNSIHEIALHAKPAILIPIPEEISHDQRTNAYTYARTGAAVVMEESNLQDSLLRAEIDRIMHDTSLYERMAQAAASFAKQDAGERIASLIMEIIEEHKDKYVKFN